jgi:uncharacterized protein YjbI with pentapeptide repeats
MANEEHVKFVLTTARAKWRKWRQPPGAPFDLSGADLREADLRGANLGKADVREADLREADLGGADLSGADLSEARLRQAHLTEADLERADLRKADLSGADLKEADLGGADLSEVDLSEANLSNANLRGANLRRANLRRAYVRAADFSHADLVATVFDYTYVDGANFDQAHLALTTFANIDLSTVRSLETVFHKGPCSVGLDTILRSRGKIPEVFLRGCGVPDNIITYIPSLVGQVFDFYSCFISYSSKDDEFAKRLHTRLQQEKPRVWFAPEDIKAGRKLYPQIDEAIRLHDKLLLVFSVDSMESEWVATEIRRARNAERDQKRQKLFPIRLCDMDTLRRWECFDADSGKDLAVEVREYHIPDFSNWKDHDSFEAAFKRLLRDLRKDEPPAPSIIG